MCLILAIALRPFGSSESYISSSEAVKPIGNGYRFATASMRVLPQLDKR